LPILSNAKTYESCPHKSRCCGLSAYQLYICTMQIIDVDWPSEPSLLQVLASDPLYKLENSY